MNRAWTTFTILTILAGMAAMVYATQADNGMVNLLILAGLVISFLDRHFRAVEVATKLETKAADITKKVEENTQLTRKTEQSINGKVEDLIRMASQAAYTKGVLDGQEQERKRQTEASKATGQP
jgi:hypothetical protein